MSLARAFTQRIKGDRSPRIKHHDISLPIELISSTNSMSYDAPDISLLKRQGFPRALNTALFKRSSGNAEDSFPASPADDTPHLTDASSIESSSPRLERNHLTQYFPANHAQPTTPAKQSNPEVVIKSAESSKPSSVSDANSMADEAEFSAPVLPRRAASHSKREHERLARKRSIRASTPVADGPKPTLATIAITEDVAEDQRQDPAPSTEPKEDSNPFDAEIAQLSAVQEDYQTAARAIERDEDMVYMMMKGLGKFDASEYLAELEPFRIAAFL